MSNKFNAMQTDMKHLAPIQCQEYSCSIIVPAKNEAGNLPDLIDRFKYLKSSSEIVIVEGGSSDATWEVAKTLQGACTGTSILAMRQSGKSKCNAVIEGIEASTGAIVIIWDADISVLPEESERFYRLLALGKASVAIGDRFTHPMDRNAMPLLNRYANRLFAGMHAVAYRRPTRDALCGSKAMFRSDFIRMKNDLGLFDGKDPFGDFDILCGALTLDLKIGAIPVRYKARTYGTTNIKRWNHGVQLIAVFWSRYRIYYRYRHMAMRNRSPL